MKIQFRGKRMPFDYPHVQRYEVNFDDIHLYLKQNYKLNFEYFEKWLDGWIRVFKNAEFDTQKQIDNLLENGVYAFEVFQKDYHFGNITFKFNFIINIVDDFVNKKRPKKSNFKYKDFHEKIAWTHTTDSSTKPLTKPIYLVWFPTEKSNYLVIDGNHRLSQLLEKRQKEIQGILIEPVHVINERILLFSVEKAMYAFLVEANFMRNEIKKGQHTHKLLFDSSGINNDFKVFNK